MTPTFVFVYAGKAIFPVLPFLFVSTGQLGLGGVLARDINYRSFSAFTLSAVPVSNTFVEPREY